MSSGRLYKRAQKCQSINIRQYKMISRGFTGHKKRLAWIPVQHVTRLTFPAPVPAKYDSGMSAFLKCFALLCTVIAICIAASIVHRQKRGVKLVIYAVALPILYFLSIGPISWINISLGRPAWLDVPGAYFYAPVRWVVENGPDSFSEFFGRYLAWWHGGIYFGHGP
jgi:hypothetical protein